MKPQNETEKIRKSALNILKKNKLLSLATYNKRKKFTNICSVYYAYDKDFTIYYWSEKSANHSKNIIKDNSVAVNIAKSTQKWGSMLKGLKIYGTAEIANHRELIKGGILYIKRFRNVGKLVKRFDDFNSKSFNSKLYVIRPLKIIVLDEDKFGKEIYKEIHSK